MRPFSKRECDLLFLYDADDRTFLVPTRMLDGKNNIAPESKYNGYEVFHVHYHNMQKKYKNNSAWESGLIQMP